MAGVGAFTAPAPPFVSVMTDHEDQSRSSGDAPYVAGVAIGVANWGSPGLVGVAALSAGATS